MQDAYKEIAPRLIGLRDALNLTVEDLARMIGVESAEVARYESGEVEIPVGYLMKVAQACETDLTVLISGNESHLKSYSLVKKGQGLSVERRKDYDYRHLAFKFTGRKMEPFLITVPPKDESQLSFNSHAGQEFIHVLEGKLELRIGEKVEILSPGDSIYFASRNPHSLRGLDGASAKFLDVII